MMKMKFGFLAGTAPATSCAVTQRSPVTLRALRMVIAYSYFRLKLKGISKARVSGRDRHRYPAIIVFNVIKLQDISGGGVAQPERIILFHDQGKIAIAPQFLSR